MFKQQRLNQFQQVDFQQPFYLDELTFLVRNNWGSANIVLDDGSSLSVSYDEDLSGQEYAYIEWTYIPEEGVHAVLQEGHVQVHGPLKGFIIYPEEIQAPIV